MAQFLGPLKLVTANTAPERVSLILGRLVESVEDQYTIIRAENAQSESGGL